MHSSGFWEPESSASTLFESKYDFLFVIEIDVDNPRGLISKSLFNADCISCFKFKPDFLNIFCAALSESHPSTKGRS